MVCQINVINSLTNHSSTSYLQKLNYLFHGVWVLFYHSFLHPDSWICIFQKTTFSVKKQITKLKRFSLIVNTNDGISLLPLQTFKNNVMIQYFTVYIYIYKGMKTTMNCIYQTFMYKHWRYPFFINYKVSFFLLFVANIPSFDALLAILVKKICWFSIGRLLQRVPI